MLIWRTLGKSSCIFTFLVTLLVGLTLLSSAAWADTGRVARRSCPLQAPPDPDMPDYGIRLLRTIDSLRFQRTVHNLGLR